MSNTKALPLITVVITTYKRPVSVVSRAVKSVLNQTYQPLELIIVDDSPDTYEICRDVEKYILSLSDKKIKYIKHEQNMGACVARNTGIENAKGEFIAFLDDDDEYLPDKLKLQLEKMMSAKADLIYCGSYTVNECTNVTTVRKTIYTNMNVYDKLIKENFIGSTSFPLIRMSVIKGCGCFDPLMQSSQDRDLWIRIAANHRVEYVEKELVNYYIHKGEQITRTAKKKISGLQRLYEKNLAYLENHKNVYSSCLMKIIPYYVMDKKRKIAFKTWLKAFWLYPWNIRNDLYYLAFILFK